MVVDGRAALEAGAPRLWSSAPGNVALDWEGGDAAATDAAFARAAHVTRLVIVNNRVVIAPMETRGVIAEYEPRDGRYTIRTPSQGVGSLLAPIARSLGVAESRVRVITDDVGGAFGIKIPPYPEHVLVAWAARRLGRPVKWIAERSESFLSDGQGRDHVTEAELALDADGEVPRGAHEHRVEHGRVLDLGCPDHPHPRRQPLRHRRLPHPRVARAVPRGVHQHGADPRLPGGGQARVQPRRRAARRHRGARDRPRPRRASPPERGAAGGDAVPHRHRHRVRQRRVRGQHG